jgi:hypothetical protein
MSLPIESMKARTLNRIKQGDYAALSDVGVTKRMRDAIFISVAAQCRSPTSIVFAGEPHPSSAHTISAPIVDLKNAPTSAENQPVSLCPSCAQPCQPTERATDAVRLPQRLYLCLRRDRDRPLQHEFRISLSSGDLFG